jgi:DNA-binding CsgD family transcriptional regulator
MSSLRTERFEQIVRRFLEAAALPELMPAALHEIAVACDAEGAVLLPIAGDQLIGTAVSRGCEELLHDFLQWPDPGRNSRMERGLRRYTRGWSGTISEQDLFTPEELARDVFFQEFMRPRGFGSYAGAVIAEMPGYLMPISIERLATRDPFTREEVRLMDKLLTQLGDAASLALQVALSSAGGVADAMTGSGQAVAILGHRGEVLHANESFDALIGNGLQLTGGRLHAGNPAMERALAAAIGRALAYDGTLGEPHGAVAIPRPPHGRPLLLRIVPVVGAANDFFHLARAIVLATDLDQSSRPCTALLRQAFDLTEAEAKLAAEIASGKSLAIIAAESGGSRETLRSRLKSIFEKTETSRQAELALLLSKVTGRGNTTVPAK